MRDPSLSWIDPGDLADALNRAGASSLARSAARAAGKGYWPLRRGSARAKPVPARRSPRATQPVPKQPVPYEPPDGPLAGRLTHYVSWLTESTMCQQIFVADSDGLVLIESNADPDLVAIASMFASVLNRVDASLSAPMRGAIAIDLEHGGSLQVVQAETGLGPHTVGFTVNRPPLRAVVDGARDGLVRVMSPVDEEPEEPELPTKVNGRDHAGVSSEAPRTTEMSQPIPARPEESGG